MSKELDLYVDMMKLSEKYSDMIMSATDQNAKNKIMQMQNAEKNNANMLMQMYPSIKNELHDYMEHLEKEVSELKIKEKLHATLKSML